MTEQQHETSRPKISPARLAANRANAKHSTGPRTKAGKQRSRRNSWKHGCYTDLFSGCMNRTYILAEFEEPVAMVRSLCRDFRRQYRPCSPEEALIVDRLATLWHRLSRIHFCAQRPLRCSKAEKKDIRTATLETEALGPLEVRLERSISRLHKDLAFLQRMRLGHDPRWGIQDVEPRVEEEAEQSVIEPTDDPMQQTSGEQAAEPSDGPSEGGASDDAGSIDSLDSHPTDRSDDTPQSARSEEACCGGVQPNPDENKSTVPEGYTENEGTNPSVPPEQF